MFNRVKQFYSFLASLVISQLSWKWDSIDIKGRTRKTSPSLFPVGVLAGIKQKRCVAFLNKSEEVLVWNVKYKGHIMKEKTFTYIEQGKVSMCQQNESCHQLKAFFIHIGNLQLPFLLSA